MPPAFATCLLRLPLCQDLGFMPVTRLVFLGQLVSSMAELEAFFSPFLKPLGLIVVAVGHGWLEHVGTFFCPCDLW